MNGCPESGDAIRHRQLEQETDHEIDVHIDHLTDQYIRRGLSADEARRRALVRFGGVTQIKESLREQAGFPVLESVGLDVRYVLRGLAKAPGFSAVAVMTLTLGIGANTAIFSIVSSLLIRSLPVAEPERLVVVSSPTSISQGRTAAWSHAVWLEVQERAGAFDGALAWSIPQLFNLAQGGEADEVAGVYASGEFFRTLGVVAHRGRLLTAIDDVRGGGEDGPVAVLSHRFLAATIRGRRQHRRPSARGQRSAVHRAWGNAAGVSWAPRSDRRFDIYLPIGTEPLIRGQGTLLDRSNSWLRVLLRLDPGQSVEAASAVLQGLQPQIREAAMPPNVPRSFQQDFLREPFTVVPVSVVTATAYLPAPPIDRVCGLHSGAAHRVREYRQPVVGERRHAPARAQSPGRPGRIEMAARAPATDRESRFWPPPAPPWGR